MTQFNLGDLSFLKNEYSIHILNIVIYFIAYYYIVFASINEGFSGFLLGIPYAIFIFLEIKNSYKRSIIIYVHIIVLLVATFMILLDKSDSNFFYPMVGNTYTISKDVNYTHGYHKNDIDIMPYNYSEHDDEKQIFSLQVNDKFTIKRQILTGHPDFSANYKFEIQAEAFSSFKEYIKSIKNKYYFNDESKIYISKYALMELMGRQNIRYIERVFIHSTEPFVYLSFYILIYPLIYLIFKLLNGRRNKLNKRQKELVDV